MTVRAVVLLLIVAFARAAEPPVRSSGIPFDSVDTRVRPQDDLYRFVNGRWLETTVMPADRVSYGTFVELADRIEEDIRAVVEEAAAAPRRSGDVQRVVDMYKSQSDEALAERLGVEPMRPYLDRIDRISSRQAFAAEMGRLASIGGGGAFATSVELDERDRRRLAVRLAQGGTMLPDRTHYLSDAPDMVAIRAHYGEYLTTIFRLVGRADPERDARRVLDLETALARAQSPNTYAREAAKNPQRVAISGLTRELPGFDWIAWARPQGIDRAASLVFDHPAFFKGFAALAASEPLDAWKAWLASRYITISAPFVQKALGDARFEFFGRILTGQREPRTHWKRAVSLVNTYLGDAVGRLYVEKHFDPATRPRMKTIVANVIEAYRQTIKKAPNLAPVARLNALDRLRAMSTQIGYPGTWRAYRGLTIKPDDLVGNIQRAQAFDNIQRVRRVRNPQAAGEWFMTPQTVNAYYAPSRNEIVVTAAMLQPPIFQIGAEDAVNYGGIGAIIAHEIAHGLEEEAGFLHRALMLVPQFNAYSPVEGLRVDGGLTYRENVADLVGLTIANQAYHLSLDGREPPVLDGFTGDQRFFMSWARVWRSLERDDYVRQYLTSNPYPPFEFRANGVVSNVPAFYEAFGVKQGDGLYRGQNQRATVWD